MFFYNKDPDFDTKLIPLHNLCCRNGIYYFRKMIKGKRYLLSLHTRDITEAYHLLFMKRYAMGSSNLDFKFFQEWLVNRENQIKTFKDLSKEEVDNEYIWKYMLGKANQSHIGIQEVPQKVRTTKHKIMEVWKRIPTTASKPVIQTNISRMELMLKLLEPYDTIEDLDNNLDLIDDLRIVLPDSRQLNVSVSHGALKMLLLPSTRTVEPSTFTPAPRVFIQSIVAFISSEKSTLEITLSPLASAAQIMYLCAMLFEGGAEISPYAVDFSIVTFILINPLPQGSRLSRGLKLF